MERRKRRERNEVLLVHDGKSRREYQKGLAGLDPYKAQGAARQSCTVIYTIVRF